MKKRTLAVRLIAMLLLLCMTACVFACTKDKPEEITTPGITVDEEKPGLAFDQEDYDKDMTILYYNCEMYNNFYFDEVTEAGDNSYQMCFKDGNQGAVAAAYVNTLGLEKIGIFYKSGDPYSQGIYEQFKDALDKSITVVEASFLKDEDDFTSQVNTLKDCSFIFMPIYYGPAETFMAMAKGKVADNATYYGCDGFDGLDARGSKCKYAYSIGLYRSEFDYRAIFRCFTTG